MHVVDITSRVYKYLINSVFFWKELFVEFVSYLDFEHITSLLLLSNTTYINIITKRNKTNQYLTSNDNFTKSYLTQSITTNSEIISLKRDIDIS